MENLFRPGHQFTSNPWRLIERWIWIFTSIKGAVFHSRSVVNHFTLSKMGDFYGKSVSNVSHTGIKPTNLIEFPSFGEFFLISSDTKRTAKNTPWQKWYCFCCCREWGYTPTNMMFNRVLFMFERFTCLCYLHKQRESHANALDPIPLLRMTFDCLIECYTHGRHP